MSESEPEKLKLSDVANTVLVEPGIRFLDEWTYVDEDEPRIGFMRRLRHWELFRYAQWTVHYQLG